MVGLISQEGRRQNTATRNCSAVIWKGRQRKWEEDTRPLRNAAAAPGPRRMRQRRGRQDGEKQVGNRTESRRLEVGGSGAEISFYGRVTNLRTRHCRVPADGRTMRLRNTMLHSGNLKAVLTTNLQPPIPPLYVSPAPSPITQYSLLRHIPPPIADRTILPPPLFSHSFALTLSCLLAFRKNSLSSQLPWPFVVNDDLQVYVCKFTGGTRVYETRNSKETAEISLKFPS